jgi:hypothetical protein
MIAKGQTFTKQQVFLDGGSFYDCTFDDCDLIYSALMPVILNGNTMRNCRWQFGGPAQNCVAFMMLLYNSGARDLIEATFESIRKGTIVNPPQTTPAGAPPPDAKN